MSAKASGTITLGDLTVNRMGFGAMRITGRGIWGEPEDPEEARRVLRRAVELDIDFIDTADSYGPDVSENLIREVLHPYSGLVIATKGGQTRQGPGQWHALGRPGYLRQTVQMSLRRLAVERIDLWQLHRVDPLTDREAQFEVVAAMQQEGLIRHVGLSEVSVDDIEAARRHFEVVSVQNKYNLADRHSEDVLEYCAREGIAFIPWAPLSSGILERLGAVLHEIASNKGITPSQLALAWLLKRSPVMLPIPGTSKVKHLEENVAAAEILLSDDEFRTLDEAGRAEWSKRR